MRTSVSIILCTRNRAADLEATLATIRAAEVPFGCDCELILIDNGSTDQTPEVARRFSHRRMTLKKLRVPSPGKSHALNCGISESLGQCLLFTDDDVRVPADWIRGMCGPLVERRADAVAGGVRLAPHLLRPWLDATKQSWLAATTWLDRESPQNMVGANMAVARHVFAKVPGFDTHIGPAALGAGEDMLFSWQLIQAGFKICPAFDVEVEHHPDAARLRREAFLRTAGARGRTNAYLSHHWKHEQLDRPAFRMLRSAARLLFRRCTRPVRNRTEEGVDDWELDAVESLAFYQQYLREQKRPRRYSLKGSAPTC